MRRIYLVSLCSLLLLGSARASTLDLKDAVIVTSAEASITVEKAARMLAEEILARTQARLGTVTEWRSGRGPAILLGTPGQLERLAGNLVTRLVTAPDGDEGFRVQVVDDAVVIAGNSDRAVLFGAGYLLRHMRMRYGKIVEVDGGLRVATAPKVSLRGRGANLDTTDVPLNNRLWLKERFAEIREPAAEEERLAAVDEIVNWTNPGPGGFYDDLGNPARQPHLVRGPGYPLDPAHLETSYLNLGATGFGPRWREGAIHSRATSFEQERAFPISWWRTAGTLHEHPLRLRYENLDPKAQYRVRVVYGATGTTQLRMVANGRHEIHPWMTRPSPSAPLEFDIPREATADGTLELAFTGEPGRGGNGRGTDVAEIWLMRRDGP